MSLLEALKLEPPKAWKDRPPAEAGGDDVPMASPPMASPPPPDKEERRDAKRTAVLMELAKWPDQAHAAWKRLPLNEQTALVMQMASIYGKDFAKAFYDFTVTGPRLDGSHYITALAHQTPEWFKSKNYKLVQKSQTQQWWIHPSGHHVYLVLDSGPSKKATPPEPLPKPPEAPKKPPPQQPPQGCSDDAKELFNITIESIHDNVESNHDQQTALDADKAKLDTMNITTPEFAKAYAAYEQALKDFKTLVENQLEEVSAARASLEEMKCDVSGIDQASPDLDECAVWIDVQIGLLEMDMRKPIKVDFK